MRGVPSLGKINKMKLANTALYVVFLVMMILLVMSKQNYHIDEYYSYGGGNQIGSNTLIIEDGKTYKPASLPFDECLTVDEGERFAYGEVWNNQGEFSVHPPLYHAILHTVCSFFPNTFSKWYAASINIVFALLTLAAVRRLAFLLTDDDRLVFAVSLMFVFSTGVLAAVSFLRMYVMAMFWVTLLEVLLVGAVGRGKLDGVFFIKLYLIAVAGALTHYYCVFFTAAICAAYCVGLMLKKRWMGVAGFCAVGALSAVTAFAVFPAMFKHILFSDRGVETRENLAQTFSKWLEKTYYFYKTVDRHIFGDLLVCLVIGTVAVIAFSWIRGRRGMMPRVEASGEPHRLGMSGVFAKRMLLTAAPCAIYFLFVAKAAPYIVDRYMFPIYGAAICAVTGTLFLALKKALPARGMYIAIALIVAATLGNEWRNAKWEYLFRWSTPLVAELKKDQGIDCLYVYEEVWQTMTTYAEVSAYGSSTFLQMDNLDRLTQTQIAQRDELVVQISNVPDREAYLQRIMELCPQFTAYEEIGVFGWTCTYRLHA